MKARSIYPVLFLIVAAGSGIALTDRYFDASQSMEIFSNLFRVVNYNYVDATKPGELMKRGLDGVLSELDPYTNYIPESEIEDYRFMTTGQYGGIGSMIRRKGDYVVISEPYENSPAMQSGLFAGDVILEVDGKSVKGKTTDEVGKVLKGQPGTEVSVLIQREGEANPISKKITRQEIKIKSVPYSGVVRDSIGYIVLTSFTEACSREVKNALQELKEKNKIKGLILDLRGNPGGLLNESVNISNLFVEKGEEIVSTKGRIQEWQKSYKGLNTTIDAQIPIAVLVDHGSASASEIVSGSLQDLDRAVIVGQKTFGKGLVQTTRNLSYNAKIKITTAKYYIPSGRCIQALDYTNRKTDGSVAQVADSVKRIFKTRNGRPFKDGGGIEPDLTTSSINAPQVVSALERKFLIFDFASLYVRQHPEKPINAARFRIDDQTYSAFLKFIEGKEYPYTIEEENTLKELQDEAKKELYLSAIESSIQELKDKIEKAKKGDIEKYSKEIRSALEREIISRYYYQAGRYQYLIDADPEIEQACALLNDSARYKTMLSGGYQKKSE